MKDDDYSKKALVEECKCTVCNRRFFRRKKKSKTTHMVDIRKTGSVTCSKRCASTKRIKQRKEYWKEYHSRPEVKARIKEYLKKRYQEKKKKTRGGNLK